MNSTYLYGLEASKRRGHSDPKEWSPVAAIDNIVQRCTGTGIQLDIGPEIARSDQDIYFLQRAIGVASTEQTKRIKVERKREEGRRTATRRAD